MIHRTNDQNMDHCLNVKILIEKLVDHQKDARMLTLGTTFLRQTIDLNMAGEVLCLPNNMGTNHGRKMERAMKQ